MTERQNIEWKEIWKDDYLAWICGFANAQGGKLYIGMNDSGEVVGVKNAKKLLATTSMTVTEISQYCGFDDSNYFSTLFKKHNAISPLEYRKKNKID